MQLIIMAIILFSDLFYAGIVLSAVNYENEYDGFILDRNYACQVFRRDKILDATGV